MTTQTHFTPQQSFANGTLSNEKKNSFIHPPVNVGHSERVGSGIAGGILAMLGLKRGGLAGVGLAALGAGLIERAHSGFCPLYKKLNISTDHSTAPQPEDFFQNGVHVAHAYTINRSAQELFDFWRNLENLPKFMTHLKEVRVFDEKHSHWKAEGPAGFTVEWDAEIINEDSPRIISWRSLAGADVDSTGSVRFADVGERGTEVKVVMNYIPPAGRFGAVIAKLFGHEPGQQIHEDLRHFKQLMEAGEIPTTKDQPRAKRCSA